MAGSYPDVPGHRFAYDRDGTVGFKNTPTGGLATLATASLQEMNDEDAGQVGIELGTSGSFSISQLGLIFPALRTLAGYYFDGSKDTNATWQIVETSPDTTTGVDGTWTSHGGLVDGGGYRSAIQALAVAGVKGIRFSLAAGAGGFSTWNQQQLHIYGSYTSALRFWHPTLDVEAGAAYLDWGDIVAPSSGSRQVRVKNTHATQTAHAVTVTREAFTDKVPSMVAQRLYSVAGSPLAASVVLGDLAPGEISDVVTIDRDTIDGAQVGLGAIRHVAQAGWWA